MKNSVLMKIFFPFLIVLILSCEQFIEEDNFADFVNPLIGTAPSRTLSALKHGSGTENNAQVIPAVTMPFGMTNWTPQTKNVETKCVAPYYYADSVITGFRGSHWLSGSCTQDYGSLTIMPLNDMKKHLPGERGSCYSHENEVSLPYYYRTLLDDYRIECELTATTRTGFLRFTFNSADSAVIVIEPNSDENEGYVKILPGQNEIIGYNPVHRIYQGWGEKAGFNGYFVARFDREFESFGIYEGQKISEGVETVLNQENAGAFISFFLDKSRIVNVKVGTSFTSIDNARKNLAEETNGLDFNSAKELLKKKWNNMLSRIEVETPSIDEKIKFYTAMYHSFLQPRIFNDCNGAYPCFAGKDSVANSGEKNYYDDFSMWDTYRALHPLYNLIIPEYSSDMVNSLITKAYQGGWLPIFPCWNSYTAAMIGDHCISVIADAYIKGIINLSESDYEIIKKNAIESPESYDDYLNGKGRRALKSYKQYGYIPLEDPVKESFHTGEQVSRTLEYAYDDFALSQIAQKMGKDNDYKYFLKRSENYKNVFDEKTKSVRGRYIDGSFTNDFIKTGKMPYITEGTPWQYTWYVPHDIEGLSELMGSMKEFNSNLDEFLEAGQYWHGNEPGHQIPFLYLNTDTPWKTDQIVSQILKEEYSSEPGGLSGNDDSGQMSAWYVFAAIGLYPVCPGKDEYAVFTPSFEKIKIRMSSGKTITIVTDITCDENYRSRQIKFNKTEIIDNVIAHSQIRDGGILEHKWSDK